MTCVNDTTAAEDMHAAWCMVSWHLPSSMLYIFFIDFTAGLFWHAPLRERSIICRHEPPQRTVLSQVDCFIWCEVESSQISLEQRPGWLLQFSGGGDVRIILVQPEYCSMFVLKWI